MRFEWWYWIIAGFCLIGLELIVPSFTIICIGFGAVVVGALKALRPALPLAAQLILWIVSSVIFRMMWFKYVKPKARIPAGHLEEGIVGKTGIISHGTEDSYGRGTVRFGMAVLGAEEWGCYADNVLQVGDSVRVVDMEGQILKVTKI